jgi:hypothetical protein
VDISIYEEKGLEKKKHIQRNSTISHNTGRNPIEQFQINYLGRLEERNLAISLIVVKTYAHLSDRYLST